jgi:hypothetical protein
MSRQFPYLHHQNSKLHQQRYLASSHNRNKWVTSLASEVVDMTSGIPHERCIMDFQVAYSLKTMEGDTNGKAMKRKLLQIWFSHPVLQIRDIFQH